MVLGGVCRIGGSGFAWSILGLVVWVWVWVEFFIVGGFGLGLVCHQTTGPGHPGVKHFT